MGWDYKSGWRSFLHSLRAYLLRVGYGLSQLLNVLIGGENTGESISGRAWRLKDRTGWKQIRIVIDWAFSPLQKNHCKLSHSEDIYRARSLIADSAVQQFND